MDAAVGATSFSAESWLEAAGAVAAENQALDWIVSSPVCPMAPAGRSAAAGRSATCPRWRSHATSHVLATRGAPCARWPTQRTRPSPTRCACSGWTSLVVLHRFRTVGSQVEALADALVSSPAAPATSRSSSPPAGSTNAGVVDDLRGLAEVAHAHDAWLHVDGAYGARGARAATSDRSLFDGLGDADSFIVDPHKWLFCTAGTCAVLYREPHLAARTHTQHGRTSTCSTPARRRGTRPTTCTS